MPHKTRCSQIRKKMSSFLSLTILSKPMSASPLISSPWLNDSLHQIRETGLVGEEVGYLCSVIIAIRRVRVPTDKKFSLETGFVISEMFKNHGSIILRDPTTEISLHGISSHWLVESPSGLTVTL